MLTDNERTLLLHAVDEFADGRSNYGEVYAAVERIIDARVVEARADERRRVAEQIAQNIEAEREAPMHYTPSEKHGMTIAARIARADAEGGDQS